MIGWVEKKGKEEEEVKRTKVGSQEEGMRRE